MSDKIVDYLISPKIRVPASIQESDAINIPAPVGTAVLDPDKDVIRFWWLDDDNVPHVLLAYRQKTMEWGETGRAEFLGDEPDSATAIAVALGSDVEYTTVGAVLLAIRNAGLTRWGVAYDGAVRSCCSVTGGFHLMAPLKELVTVAAAASTDSIVEIPGGSLAVATALVVADIPGVTSWGFGDAGSATRWGSALSPLAGTKNEGVALTNGWVFFASATAFRITPNTTPSAATGQVRIFALYQKVGAPTS